MRLEANVSDNRGTAAMQLAEELGLTQSQLIDEALSLFLKAVLEARRGRRLVTLDPDSSTPATLLATPTLAALEWGFKPEKRDFPAQALENMKPRNELAPSPSPHQRDSSKRHGR